MKNLSIDIGGTKIRVCIYDEGINLLREKVYKTHLFFANQNPVDFRKFLFKVSVDLGKSFNKIGLSIKGAIHNNTVYYSSLVGGKCLIKIKNELTRYFEFHSFSANNDVVSMAKAEIKYGKGRFFYNCLYINLGTGIRFVQIYKHRIISGCKNLAGEISQETIWVPEMELRMPIDELVSGRGISNIYSFLSKKKLNAKQIFRLNSKPSIELFAKYLAKVVSSACYYYNPDAIIFSGSLTLSSSKWLNEFKSFYQISCSPLFIVKNIYISKVSNPASLGAIIK